MAVTLTRGESRLVWVFLTATTVSELIALVWIVRPGASWWATLWRYGSDPPGTAYAWALAALVTTLYVARAASRSPVIRLHAFAPGSWGPIAALRLFAVCMALVTGLFEELFFRKIVMDVAERHGLGAALQVAASAVIFGLVHGIWVVFGGNLRAALAIVGATAALGGLLAAVYLIGGRSLAPCIAAHVCLNLILEPWMAISSATRSWGRAAVRG